MIHINLLPYRKKRRQRLLRRTLFSWLATVVLVIGGVLVGDFFLREQILAQKSLQTNNTRKITELNGQLGEIQTLRTRKGHLETRLKAMDTLQKGRRLSIRLLTRVRDAMPEKMWLKTLSTTQDRLTISGVAQSNTVVARFMSRIEEAPELLEVKLTEIEQSTIEDYVLKKFTLNASLTVP